MTTVQYSPNPASIPASSLQSQAVTNAQLNITQFNQLNKSTQTSEASVIPKLPNFELTFGGDKASAMDYNLNIFSNDYGTMDVGGGRRVRVNVNWYSHTYTYLNKDDATELVRSMKKVRRDISLGVVSVGGFFATPLGKVIIKSPPGRYFGGWYAGASAIYVHGSQTIIDEAEYCVGRDKGMWLDAEGGVLFLNPKIKCDR